MIFLRKISKESGAETGFCLGKGYVYESREIVGEDRWSEIIRNVLDFMHDEAKQLCYGVVYDDNGEATPLFPSDNNYLVTASGQTHAKL